MVLPREGPPVGKQQGVQAAYSGAGGAGRGRWTEAASVADAMREATEAGRTSQPGTRWSVQRIILRLYQLRSERTLPSAERCPDQRGAFDALSPVPNGDGLGVLYAWVALLRGARLPTSAGPRTSRRWCGRLRIYAGVSPSFASARPATLSSASKNSATTRTCSTVHQRQIAPIRNSSA